MARHIVIVCGYGCHLVPELQGYLDRIVQFCNEQQSDCLILCGGFTQRKSAPGMSEARLMKEYILPRLKYSPSLVFLEENSYITPDNIKNAAETIRTKDLLNIDLTTKLTVFCEATRALKVDDAIRYCIGRRATIETASWELMSPTKQIISTLYDWATIRFPPLACYLRNQRLKRAEQI
jgi:hypothetical protein